MGRHRNIVVTRMRELAPRSGLSHRHRTPASEPAVLLDARAFEGGTATVQLIRFTCCRPPEAGKASGAPPLPKSGPATLTGPARALPVARKTLALRSTGQLFRLRRLELHRRHCSEIAVKTRGAQSRRKTVTFLKKQKLNMLCKIEFFYKKWS